MASRDRIRATGRAKTGRFTRLPEFILVTEACQALSLPAFRLWVELIRCHNGGNNGNLSAAEGTMAHLGLSRKTLAACRRELLDAGFIAVTRQGRRGGDGGAYPTLYRLTHLVSDEMPDIGLKKIPPTLDFLKRNVPDGGWRASRRRLEKNSNG